MKQSFNYLLILLFTFLYVDAKSQSTDKNICKTFQKHIDKKQVPPKLKSPKDSVNFLLCIMANSSDSLSENRTKELLSILQKFNIQNASSEVKSSALNSYLQLLSISRRSPQVSFSIISYLKRIDRSSYDSLAIEKLAGLINDSTLNLKDIVLLAGYVNNSVLSQRVKNLLYSSNRRLTKQEIWAIYLSLARMGDPEAIDFIYQRISGLKMNSNLVDGVFPDLVYTRQERLYNYMIEALYSDEKLCDSPNPDSDSMMPCGYRILELLAPNIIDFPIKTLPSGDLNVSNYPQALKEAREWFNQNRTTYKIATEKF